MVEEEGERANCVWGANVNVSTRVKDLLPNERRSLAALQIEYLALIVSTTLVCSVKEREKGWGMAMARTDASVFFLSLSFPSLDPDLSGRVTSIKN